MSDTKDRAEPTVIDDLARIATGSLTHDYNGQCPDDVEGHDSRDPECPACQVLLRYDART